MGRARRGRSRPPGARASCPCPTSNRWWPARSARTPARSATTPPSRTPSRAASRPSRARWRAGSIPRACTPARASTSSTTSAAKWSWAASACPTPRWSPRLPLPELLQRMPGLPKDIEDARQPTALHDLALPRSGHAHAAARRLALGLRAREALPLLPRRHLQQRRARAWRRRAAARSTSSWPTAAR